MSAGDDATVPHATGTPALLSDVLAAAPSGMLIAMSAPLGTDIPVTGSVLLDVTEASPPDIVGGVLLMVGVLSDDAAALRLVRQAGTMRYSAVVVKKRGRSMIDLVSTGSEVGIAVLQVVDEVGWSAVHAVVVSAIGAAGRRIGASSSGTGDELHALTNAVASLFGGSVAIEDLDRRVIAYSSIPGQRIDALREAGILQRAVPSRPADRQKYQHIFATSGPVRFPVADDELARSAIAVRAGDVPLGSIWVIEGTADITDDHLRSLEEATQVASVHLLRLRHADEIGLLARGDALVSLLDSHLPTDTLMARIGMSPGPARMMLVSTVDPAARAQLPLVSAAAGRYLMAYSPSAVVASLPGRACLLLPDHGNADADRLAAGVCSEATRAAGSAVRVSCGSAAVYPADIASMFTEVTEVAAVAESIRYRSGVVHMSDIADHALLRTINDVIAERPRLQSPAIELLMEHDDEHRGALAPTLLAWIEEQGDARRTGERLSMHANTVRYRVRRALELMGNPSMDPDARLVMWLRLRRHYRKE